MPFVEVAFVNTFRAMLGDARHRTFMEYWLNQAAQLNWLSPLFDHPGGVWRIGSLGLAELASAQGSAARQQIDRAIARHPDGADLALKTGFLFADKLDDIGRTVVDRFNIDRTEGEQIDILLEVAIERHEVLTRMLTRMLFVKDSTDLDPWFQRGGNLAADPKTGPLNAHAVAGWILQMGVIDFVRNHHPSLSAAILGRCLIELQMVSSTAARDVIDGLRDPESAVLDEVNDKLSLNRKFVLMAATYGGFTVPQIQAAFAIAHLHKARMTDPSSELTVMDFMEEPYGGEVEFATNLKKAWEQVFHYV